MFGELNDDILKIKELLTINSESNRNCNKNKVNQCNNKYVRKSIKNRTSHSQKSNVKDLKTSKNVHRVQFGDCRCSHVKKNQHKSAEHFQNDEEFRNENKQTADIEQYSTQSQSSDEFYEI